MKLTINKTTGTYADALHAVGLASLTRDLGLGTIRIRDIGGSCSVETSVDISYDQWPSISPGYWYIWLASDKDDQPKPSCAKTLDYEDARQQNERWKAFEKSQGKSKKAKLAIPGDLEEPQKPPAEYSTAAILASMRSGWSADKQLARWIEKNPEKALAWVRAELTGTPRPADIPDISNSQIFNPVSGKGRSAAKSILGSPASLPGVLIDPFAEWMKFRGLWEAMLLYRSGEDFKLFVIEPSDIPLDRLQTLNAYGGPRQSGKRGFGPL